MWFASTAFFDGTQWKEQNKILEHDPLYIMDPEKSCIQQVVVDGQSGIFCEKYDPSWFESYYPVPIKCHRFIVKTGKILLTFLNRLTGRESARHLEK